MTTETMTVPSTPPEEPTTTPKGTRFAALRRRLALAATAVLTSFGLLIAVPGQAHAAPVPDLYPSWISWPTLNQCADRSGSGTWAYAQPTYRVASAGWYGMRIHLTTSTGRNLAYSEFTQFNRTRTPLINIRKSWNTGTYSYYGQSFVTVYIYKWMYNSDGTWSWRRIANESLACV